MWTVARAQQIHNEQLGLGGQPIAAGPLRLNKRTAELDHCTRKAQAGPSPDAEAR
jgi:hypothetical protein